MRLPYGEFSLYHLGSGKVLDGNGTDVYFYGANQDGYQRWELRPAADGYVQMWHVKSGHLLTHRDKGLGLQAAGSTDAKRQLWRMEPVEENRYLTLSPASAPGQMLDGNGSALYLHAANGGSFQKWSYLEHFETANWMGTMDGRRPINQLSIPGTHDSGTATVGPDGAPALRDCSWYDAICHAQNAYTQTAWLAEQAAYQVAGGAWAQCQTMTIPQQLVSGIRFLDIRCRHYQNNLLIHHGSFYCNLSFADVVRDCIAFLQAHPKETILMSVKPEYNHEGNTDGRSFERMVLDAFRGQEQYLSTRTDYAPLDALRGKVQLVRRFDGSTGIDAQSNWPDDAIGGSAKLRIQDVYNVKLQGKAEKAVAQVQLLQESTAHPDNDTLYFNFLSGFAIETPAAFALVNNHAMYLGLPSGRMHLGVMPMDFPPSYLINAIIRSNF